MFLLFCFSCSIIRKLNFSETKDVIQDKQVFVLAISSHSFDYADTIQTFVEAIHQAKEDREFIILDVAEEGVSAEELGVSSIPAVISFDEGKVRNALYSYYTVSSIIDFIYRNTLSYIKFIKSDEELQTFLQSSSFGIIVAEENINISDFSVLIDFYHGHMVEISLAFCDPSLLEKPGCYVYRFVDNVFIEIPDLSKYTDENEMIEMLSPLTVISVHKFDYRIGAFLEEENQKFIIMALDMNNSYYLSPDQLKVATELSKYAECNVTFIPLEYTSISHYRYGFPIIKNESIFFVDATKSVFKKYILEGELTLENGINFIKSIKEGTTKRFYKSAEHKEGKNITEVNAYELNDFINVDKSILGLYYFDESILDKLVESKEEILKSFPSCKIGQYSLAHNEPTELLNKFSDNIFLIYSKGKLIKEVKIPNTKQEILQSIINAYKELNEEL